MSSAPGITLVDYWMGREVKYARELTYEIIANSKITVERANAVLACFGQARRVSSGWRPGRVNAGVPGAAVQSKHIDGQAIDLEDADGELDRWCLDHLPTLREIGLWLEHPGWTVGWCHLQIVPPRSGARVFLPSSAEPVTLAYGRTAIFDARGVA